MSQEPSTSGNRGRIWRHSQVVRDLPPEVMDMIFDLLRPLNWDAQRPPGAVWWRSGREELMACYAVSRFWRESARRHLFRDFIVNFRCELPPPPGMLADLYAPHYRPTAYWLPDLPALFQFLNDSPAITKYIRRLRLHCNVAVQLPKIQPGVLLGVLRSVPNLRVLHLSNVALTVPPRSLCRGSRRLYLASSFPIQTPATNPGASLIWKLHSSWTVSSRSKNSIY
ncbi:hypothetical protein PHLGIDRAFT_278864 [Phlebiopsis gigantea 11061_1 CR5-6]|uniref:F-box domain-containing protein n=1 Tax=Phlebiopsis gigantea (strain 11061_1 CR5-6) TaxID=745531 RepID=A0A0C3PCD0_PHLG1|nr:hypothetical protein PHLGIDRAFT_278864 [Phlebiopsis gigantea 11061_1 CR5-6]